SAALAALARDHIITHPAHSAALALRKWALFWAPNTPDGADMAASPLLARLRVAEVAQYLLIAALGLAGLLNRRVDGGQRAVLAVAIGGFWALHAAAYIIIRYRDPIMPVLMLLAAALMCRCVARWRARHDAPAVHPQMPPPPMPLPPMPQPPKSATHG
ncbi:MAG: hypothetical protein ACKOUM_12770, partial [Sphingopyxis sp.]